MKEILLVLLFVSCGAFTAKADDDSVTIFDNHYADDAGKLDSQPSPYAENGSYVSKYSCSKNNMRSISLSDTESDEGISAPASATGTVQ